MKDAGELQFSGRFQVKSDKQAGNTSETAGNVSFAGSFLISWCCEARFFLPHFGMGRTSFADPGSFEIFATRGLKKTKAAQAKLRMAEHLGPDHLSSAIQIFPCRDSLEWGRIEQSV
jgi:hypothetical protein